MNEIESTIRDLYLQETIITRAALFELQIIMNDDVTSSVNAL